MIEHSDSLKPASADTDGAVGRLVSVLGTIDPGRASRSVLASGHYAAVLEVGPNLGIALTTDGVGSKLIIAERTGRLDSVGIDCVAMNVNDIICVGAEPIALVDYIAVEQANSESLKELGKGLKAGAELAGIEIPGGEVAILPEVIRGHPSPNGFDLAATCIGTVALDEVVTGADCGVGDVLIGLPSSGMHSNGYTLARRILLEEGALKLNDKPAVLGRQTLADALLLPTVIYVRAICELLDSDIRVHGLAHITGGGLRNLFRLSESVGFAVDHPLPISPIFELIQEYGRIPDPTMWEQFNMGCGFCVVTPAECAQQAIAMLNNHHPGTRAIGFVTEDSQQISVHNRATLNRRV